MPFYLTGNPVPSASVLDIRDNSQNLDLALNDITSSFWSDRLGRSRMSWFGLESAFTVKLSDFESRFSTQIVEQETTFDASQADKENRFQAFLDSSGYVFLGDYEDGPFQFSARNQYIRYNNQYYRLNAATDVGFITTGTTATSFANDVTHFVLMDGDTLRQNLAANDGLKLVGKCHSAIELRSIEPTYDGQSITLARTSASGPLVNAVLTYDASDSTTADDGYSVFVTPNGARWKTDVSKGVDVRLHESIKADGSNFATVLNDIEAKEVQKIIFAKNVNIANRLIIIPAKFINGAAMELTINEEIKHCSLFYVVFKGDVTLVGSKTSGYEIKVDNYYYYTKYGLSGWDIGLVVHQHTGCFKSDGGTIHIKGIMHKGIVDGSITASTTNSTASGLLLGNTDGNSVSSNILNVRGHVVDNIKCTGFYRGLDLTMRSTYLNSISNYKLMFNMYGLGNTIPDVNNGGERITMTNGIISNNLSNGIHWGAISAGIDFNGVSIDYNGGHAINMTYSGRGNRFNFTGLCWIEGWGEGCYVFNAEESGVWAEKLSNHIFFGQGTYILARINNPISELSPRPIFYNRGNVTDYIYDNGIYIDFKGKAASKTQSLVDIGSQNRIVLKRVMGLTYPAPCLTSYKHTLNFGLYNFSGTTGANLKGFVDAGTQMLFSTINNDAALSITYGDIDTSDVNTFTHAQDVIVTSTATDARFSLQNDNIKVPLRNPEEKVYGGITLNPGAVTSGELFIALRLRIYRAGDLSTLIGVIYGSDVKVSDYSTNGGDGSEYISLQCAASVPASAIAAYGGSIVVVPAISFVGAKGSYKIRLPAFWKE
ncbi:TPA: hypothetical protein ACTW0G_001344 [Raoultella planticola]